jgi:hypothetical protein
MRSTLLILLLSGCVTPVGQKIQGQLIETEVSCEAQDDGGRVGELTLQAEDDLYTAEVLELSTGVIFTLPAVRTGTTARFTCPEGLGTFTVRQVVVLSEARESEPVEAPAPP